MPRSNQSLQWDAFAHFQAFTIMALIVLILRLHTVNEEVKFLKVISIEWISKQMKEPGSTGSISSVSSRLSEDDKLDIKSLTQEMENFKHDIDALIVDMWSARTILFLSVAFASVYIISWGWMSYVIKDRRNMREVSLKTILLLAVFAAVDIVASGGFVLVRIVMYFIRDKDLKFTTTTTEFAPLTALAAIRLTTLQSNTAFTDILVSIVIGCLTGLRVYSVMGAVSFYNNLRKRKEEQKQNFAPVSPPYDTSSKSYNEYPHRTSSRASHTHPKGYPQREGSVDHRRFSMTATSSLTDEDIFHTSELKVQAAEMPMHMQKFAIKCATQACQIFTTEKHIAESIKQDFDSTFQPTWHCIVGRNWGSCVTHSKHCYIRLLYKDLTILLYKSM